MSRRSWLSRAIGAVMLPLSVVPFIAVRGDVVREHDAYVLARMGRVPLGTQPGMPLPRRAPAPALDAPIHPAIPLGGGVHVTLGTRDGSVLVELDRAATAEGRRILVDVNGDGAADVTLGAGTAGVRIVACQVAVSALAGAGSGRRADGGTAIHLPAGALGTTPRFGIGRKNIHDPTCAGALGHARTVALPEVSA